MDSNNERFILEIARTAVSVDGHILAEVLEQEMIPDSVKESTKASLQAVANVLRDMGTTIHPLDC